MNEKLRETRLARGVREGQDQLSQVREPRRRIFGKHEVSKACDVARSVKLHAVAEEMFWPFRVKRTARFHERRDRGGWGSSHDVGHDVEGKEPLFDLKFTRLK